MKATRFGICLRLCSEDLLAIFAIFERDVTGVRPERIFLLGIAHEIEALVATLNIIERGHNSIAFCVFDHN